jgi:hypothetical protein
MIVTAVRTAVVKVLIVLVSWVQKVTRYAVCKAAALVDGCRFYTRLAGLRQAIYRASGSSHVGLEPIQWARGSQVVPELEWDPRRLEVGLAGNLTQVTFV